MHEHVSVTPISPVQTRRRITIAREVFARLIGSIKPAAILLSTLLFALTVASGGDFIQTLSPEKIRTAGLNKLTPEELTQLDDLIQQYKAGATPLPAAPTTPAVQVVKAESKQAQPSPTWVGALLTLEKAGNNADRSDFLESRLTGNFSGWTGRSTFRLDNGQLWKQVNGDSYIYSPTLKTPKVKIYPASFNSFWLEIEGVHERCRVKPLQLE